MLNRRHASNLKVKALLAAKPKKNRYLKPLLLAGTALVGIGLFPVIPRSATITYTNGQDDTTNYTQSTSDTFQTAAGGGITAIQSGTINLLSFNATINVQDATDHLTVSGVISGTGGVIKSGSGTLVLSGVNTYANGTAISGGILEVTNDGAISTGALVLAGGALAFQGGVTLSNATNLTGSVTSTLQSLAGGTEAATLSGTILLAGNTLAINTFDLADTLTLSGVISGGGDGLEKTGSGTLVLSGSNTYTGGTVIDGGTLRLLNSAGAGTGVITVNGSTIELGDGINLANAIDMNADTTLATVAGGSITAEQSGAINTSADAAPHTLTLDAMAASDNLTVSGIISGSGDLVNTGSGTLVLSGSNTFTGGLDIQNGTVGLNNDAGAGTGTISFTTNTGSVLDLNSLTIANDFVFDSFGFIQVDGGTTSTLSGSIATSTGSDDVVFNPVTASDTLIVNGDVSGSATMFKQGSGLLILSGSNTNLEGDTSLIIQEGSVQLNSDQAAGGGKISFSGTGSDSLIVTSGLTVANDLEFVIESGIVQTVAGGTEVANLSGDVDLGANIMTVDTIDANDTLTFSGVISGSGGVAKNGSGTLALSNTNTYTGDTDINAGTLVLNGSLTSDVTVAAGATLKGTGTITGALDISGTVATGNSIGTLNVTGDVIFETGSVFAVEVDDTPGTDLLDVTGSATINAGVTVDVTLAEPGTYVAGTTFTFLDTTGGVTGTFDTITSDLAFIDLQLNHNANDVEIEITAINLTTTVIDEATYNTAIGEANVAGINIGVPFQSAGVTFGLTGDATAIDSGTDTVTLVGDGSTINGNGFVVLDVDSGTVQILDLTLNGEVRLDGATSGLELLSDTLFGTLNAVTGSTIDLGSSALTLSQDGNSSVASVISGSGSLVKLGTGMLTLSGTSTYTGGTTLNGGTLQILNSAALGTGALDILGSTVEYGDSVNMANAINLSADVTLKTLDGGTETAEQSGAINTSADAAPHTLTVSAVDASDTFTISGAISGSGSLVAGGSGTVVLSGSNTFSGGATLTSGTLVLQGGSALSDTGTLAVNGGTLQLNTSEAAGTLSGSGGTINLQAFTLTINQSTSGTFAGVISGSGGLTKAGTGILTLNGTNTYTGDTNVDVGTLLNNGFITSNVNVALGAVYGGDGTTTGDIDNFGTIAPGNSIGTMEVIGAVTFNAGSDLQAEIMSDGTGDLLNITGSATIDNAATVNLVVLDPDDFAGITDFTVLFADGGYTGQFGTGLIDGLTIDDMSLWAVLIQDNSSVIARVGDLGSIFSSVASTANQTAIAGPLDTIDPQTNADFAFVLSQFLGLTDTATMQGAMDQMTGEGFATLTSSTLASTGLRLRGLAKHMNEARLCHIARDNVAFRADCDIIGRQGQSANWGNGLVWSQAYYGSATMGSGGGDFDVLGFDLGFDRWIADNVMVGLSGGFARDNVSNFASLSSGETKYTHFGGHAGFTFGQIYVDGMVDFASLKFTTNRNIAFGSLSRIAKGAFDGKTISVSTEVGYNGQTGNINVQPFLVYQFVNIQRDGFTETGGGSLNLTVNEENIVSTQVSLGVRFNTLLEVGGMTVKPELRGRFIREFGNAGDARTSLVNFGGSSVPGFVTINDTRGFKDAAQVGFSFDISRGGALHIVIDGDYLMSDEYDMWTGSARLLWMF